MPHSCYVMRVIRWVAVCIHYIYLQTISKTVQTSYLKTTSSRSRYLDVIECENVTLLCYVDYNFMCRSYIFTTIIVVIQTLKIYVSMVSIYLQNEFGSIPRLNILSCYEIQLNMI